MHASVTTTDAAGNSATATDDQAYTVDTTAPAATITLDAITGTTSSTAVEAGGQVAITGTVGGDVQVGDTVTLTVNSNSSYTGLVQADFTFSIDVAGSDLCGRHQRGRQRHDDRRGGQLHDGDRRPGLHGRHGGACRHDHARRHRRDNVVNSRRGRRPVAVTGTVGGDVQVGDTVTLTVNGNSSYTGLVQADFTFSIDVAGSDLCGRHRRWTPASPPPTRRATPHRDRRPGLHGRHDGACRHDHARRHHRRTTSSTRRRLAARSRSPARWAATCRSATPSP